MSRRDNQTIFSTTAFKSWANRETLTSCERVLIESHLDRRGPTVEAGTAGGRILLEMEKLGYSSLHGFDFVPEFIDEARRRNASGKITYKVCDATSLEYAEASFAQAIYLQQIICFIESADARRRALQESYRILRPGGIALFSFLCYDARMASASYRLFSSYLRLVRMFGRSKRSEQYMPWLLLGGRFNLGALVDRGPHHYWYKVEEVCELLEETGYLLISIGSTRQVTERKPHTSYQSLMTEPLEGMLFCVCMKPLAAP